MIVISLFVLVKLVYLINFEISIESDGKYSVNVDKKRWLTSFEYGIRSANEWYSSGGSIGKSKKKLFLVRSSETQGIHQIHGEYTETTLEWHTEGSNVPYETTFQVFSDVPAVIFTQRFPNGVSNASLGDSKDVISSFPSFLARDVVSQLNYLEFKGNQLRESTVGHWDVENLYRGGSLSGPIVLFNDKLESIIISPLSNFMVGSQVRDSKSIPMDFACGFNGQINDIPANFTHSTLVYAADGINNLFLEYGDFMLSHFKKRRVLVNEDLVISHLSYWTDNGAYYYYLTEPQKNYEQTLNDVSNYLDKEGIPAKSLQLDSWWYFQDNGGIKLWEPQPNIFPDGILNLSVTTGLPVSLHSKYFSLDNDYMKMNFSFTYDEGGKAAIPKSKELYKYIMKKAKSWGMILYEQDWLQIGYTGISAVQSTVQTGRDWFLNMAEGAKDVGGITIQLCSIYPCMILQALETPQSVISQSRASSDYHPSHKQFDIGLSSMFLHALGLVPYKDTFFSFSGEEKGCRYTSGLMNKCKEVNNVLQVVISALSTGPVGVGDGIGYVNKLLVMETCTSDGLILKTDRPAYEIDEVFRKSFFDPIVLLDKVWGTYTSFEGFGTYCYIFSMDLVLDFKFYPSMLPFPKGEKDAESYYVVKYVTGEENISSITLTDKDHPVVLKRSQFHPLEGTVQFEMHLFIPKLTGCKYTFLKEMKKIVDVSKSRVKGISCDSQSTSLKIEGGEGESVRFAFIGENADMNIMYVDCLVSGSSMIRCEQEKCSCS